MLREGDEVSYDLIDDRHLVNILMWLRRQSQQRAQQAADEAGLELGPSGWRLRRHPQFDSLVAEARRRGGQVAAAAALIDSPDPLDEEVVRQGVPRR